ncbi:MAG: thioredoxin domain-containing protein [Candidatus Gottesmanbacteria bacterium]|nr:thioredoxin domain-containing protein [Candidatus Gottesmanbacteria bacterium]
MANEHKKFGIPTNLLQLLLVLAVIVAAYFIGNLTAKVQYLSKGSTPTAAAGTTPAPGAGAPAAITATIAQIKDVFKKDVIKFGNANSKLLLIEIADPSCPFCHMAAGQNPEANNQSAQFKMVADGGTYIAPVPEFKKLLDQGKAAYAYIYSPGHGNGEMAIKSLYCAFEKGKFWEVHSLIMSEKGYEIQNGTDPAGTPSTAPVVKNDKTKSQDMADFLASAIDPAFMKSCLDSGKYDARLAADTQLATSLGVQGTPGFFINAKNFAGAFSFKDMQSTVDEALK